MKKYILTFLSFSFLLSCPIVFAASDKGSQSQGKVGGSHGSEHPPHSHDHHDHLKHIRGHGNERKKKTPKS